MALKEWVMARGECWCVPFPGADGERGGVELGGDGRWGQLGHGDLENQSLPSHIVALTDRAVAVSAGGRHSLALATSRVVWSWGEGSGRWSYPSSGTDGGRNGVELGVWQ